MVFITVYFEVYGCQMNANDSEVVLSILLNNGYTSTKNLDDADVVLLVTCAIRDNAEQKIWRRLKFLRHLKKINRKKLSKPPLKIGLLGKIYFLGDIYCIKLNQYLNVYLFN